MNNLENSLAGPGNRSRPARPEYADMAAYERTGQGRQHHRGKSSESVLDKGAVIAALGVKPGETVLDAGCGNGYMAREFSRLVGKGGRVYALDPDKIAVADLRAGTAGTNITAVVGEITGQSGLPAGVFDLIYLSNVVHGIAPGKIRGFEREVKRLLAEGGRLAIVEIVKRSTPFGPPLKLRLSPEDLRRELDLAPLETVEVGEFFYLQLFARGRPRG